MANYRLATILAQEAIDTAGTKTIDLDVTDSISEIDIRVRATNSSHTPTAHPAAILSKVEIVDGSDVLMSLNGHELQALQFYHYGKPSQQWICWASGAEFFVNFKLPFGRRLWDPQLALDPTRYTNPQLKITHNKASGGCAPASGYMQIDGHLFDEKKVSPTGFLSAKEWYNYNLTSGAYEYVDLPDDMAIRLMLIRSLYPGQSPHALFSAVKLSYNQDKKVIFDDTTPMLSQVYDIWGPYVESHEGYVGTGATNFYIAPTTSVNPVSGSWGGARDYYGGYSPWGGRVQISSGAADTPFQSIFSGYNPHGCVPFPMGDLQLMEDWWQPPAKSGVRARILGANSSATAQVILQQLRKY